MNSFYKENNISMNLGKELIELNERVINQELIIGTLELQAAMYKAFFYSKSELAYKIQKQIKENDISCVGEWNGFCYASWRAKAVYRTLDDMLNTGLITQEEYKFCEIL